MAPPPPPDRRAAILEALTILQEHERQEKNVFKARAYTKVIEQFKVFPGPIRTMADIDAVGVEGMGAKIRAKVAEILTTGHNVEAEAIAAAPDVEPRKRFAAIYGIGPVAAKSLVENGFRTLADLRAEMARNPRFLNEKQRIGVRHAEDILKRIPRAEMERHAAAIQAALRTAAPGGELVAEVVGSYRRGAADSGDIDVLMTPAAAAAGPLPAAAFAAVIDELARTGYVVDTLARGPHKFMAFVRLPGLPARRLDLLYTPPAEYPFALLYFTGSDKNNIRMRRRALELGYSLSEHGLIPAAPPDTPLKTERDIFKFLGLPYLDPTQRI